MTKKHWQRRGFAHLACLLALTCASPAALRAQGAYPSQPIEIVVPYTAGGGVDSVARILAEDMRESLGGSIIVENAPGAGGTIGTQRVARAEGDGYKILLCAAGEVAIAPHLLKGRLAYDPAKDLAPISLVVRVPNVLVVGPATKVKTLDEFIAAAKAEPGTLAYASSGVGNPQHLAGEVLNRLAGIETIHTPYRGSAQQITDVVGGHIAATYASVATVLPFIKDGKVTALGVTSTERVPALPDVPAIKEHPGLEAYEMVNWFGLFAPATTPAPVIEKLHAAVLASLQKPKTRSQLEALGVYPSPTSESEFKSFVQSESDKYGRIIAEAKITAE